MEEDIFDEDGALSATFLIARGYYGGNGCRNCPYTPRHGGLDAALPALPDGDQPAPMSLRIQPSRLYGLRWSNSFAVPSRLQ